MSWRQAVEAGSARARLWLSRWRTLQPLRILEKGTWRRWQETRLPEKIRWRQIRYLPKFLSPTERRTLFIAGLLAVGSLLFLLTRFYTFYLPDKPLRGGEYVEGVVGSPRYVHPFYAPLNPVDLDLVSLVYRGLVRLGSGGSVIPDAAESYNVSADGLVYTFILRDYLAFHDGQALTAADVVWTYEQAKDPRWQSPLQVSFQNVEVQQTGERMIEFRISKPSTSFLSSLTVGIVPAHLWRNIAPDTARADGLMRKPVGSGEWKVKDVVTGANGVIHAYQLARADTAVPPYLDQLTLRFYTSWEELQSALKDRSIDGVAFVPFTVREELVRQHHFQFSRVELPQYVAVFFQTGNNPALADVRVRKALGLGIDRGQLVKDILHDEGEPLSAPSLPGLVESSVVTSDVAAAQASLSAAGWQMPKATSSPVFRQHGKEILQLTLTTADLPEYTAVAGWLAKQWGNLGIQVKIEAVPVDSIVRDIIQPRKYEALLYGQILGADADPYPFWHSSQEVAPGLNLTNYLNRRVDELLEEARHQLYQDGRRTRYQEWLQALAIDMPAIFLYRPLYWYAVDQRVRGTGAAVLASPASRVWLWDNWYRRSRKTLFSRGE